MKAKLKAFAPAIWVVVSALVSLVVHLTRKETPAPTVWQDVVETLLLLVSTSALTVQIMQFRQSKKSEKE